MKMKSLNAFLDAGSGNSYGFESPMLHLETSLMRVAFLFSIKMFNLKKILRIILL